MEEKVVPNEEEFPRKCEHEDHVVKEAWGGARPNRIKM